MRVICPAHLIPFDLIIIIFGEEIPIMQFCPTSFYFFPFRSKNFLGSLFSSTLSLYSSPKVRDEVSHLCRAEGKITVL
jgi:hypothetical protein